MTSDSSPDRERMQLAERLAGLANYHLRAGRLTEAADIIHAAAGLESGLFRLRMAAARLAILRGERDDAVERLEEARAVDPFDDEAADMLAQLRAERKENLSALEGFVDARLLGGGVDADRDAELERREAALCERLGFADAESREAVLTERRERIEELADEAETEAALAGGVLNEPDPAGGAAVPGFGADEGTSTLTGTLASREALRAAAFFAGLTDRELDLIVGAVDVVTLDAETVVFRQGQPSEDLYVVESGTVTIQRETPFGTQVLATVRRGSLFGEMNFIDGRTRSADAVVAESAALLRISHDALRSIFDSERGLAVAFLEEFWKALSDKVREGNEMMKSFFPAGPPTPPKAPPDAQAPAAPGEAPQELAQSSAEPGVDARDAAGVLQEKGLSGHEMEVLAGFAQSQRLDIEQHVFREGEPGTRLYIVFEGRVRISKHIPGVGEEALAILDRGEFFGEMAIIDGAPRSASAVAHVSDTTVLSVDKSDIDGILTGHEQSAYEFLLILCRILSGRLREINDKIVQWRMMSGSF